jgi:hypothetical protein
VLRGQRNGSPRSYSRFSRPEPQLFLASSSSVILTSTHEAEWTPFQTHCPSENLKAPGIEPRTSGSVARNSDHRSGPEVTLLSVYTKTCRAICYHTLRSSYMQVVKWCLSGRSRQLVETYADAERTVQYFFVNIEEFMTYLTTL